jgi:hypothetical protein
VEATKGVRVLPVTPRTWSNSIAIPKRPREQN